MTGFWILAVAYAACWLVMLAPGALFMARRRPMPSGAGDPAPDAWVRRLARDLAARTAGTVRPDEVPFVELEGRRRKRPSPSAEALRVEGDLLVPEGAVVAVALLVEGALTCGPGAALVSPVWAGGDVALGEGASAAAIVAGGTVTLDRGAAVSGRVAAAGPVVVGPDGRVGGSASSRDAVVLDVGAQVASAVAPVVRGPDPGDDLDVPDAVDPVPLEDPEWDDELDDALSSVWPGGDDAEPGARLADIAEAFAERTGLRIRGVHLLRRARDLRLNDAGIPARPAVLGRRAAWILTPEVVRVGSDLKVPTGAIVSYAVVVEGAVEVFEGAELEGPVHAGRGLLFRSGAVAHSRAVSDGLVVCEEGSSIVGPVDSSAHVLLFAGARVGAGVSAGGIVGLEPGAEVLGPVTSVLGVQGHPGRPDVGRTEPEDAPVPSRWRRRRVRRRATAGDTPGD